MELFVVLPVQHRKQAEAYVTLLSCYFYYFFFIY